MSQLKLKCCQLPFCQDQLGAKKDQHLMGKCSSRRRLALVTSQLFASEMAVVDLLTDEDRGKGRDT